MLGLKKITPYIICFAVIATIIFYRYGQASFSDPALDEVYKNFQKNKKPFVTVATIISEPEDRKTAWRYVVRIDNPQLNGSKLLVRDSTQKLSQHLEYGDQVTFSATLKKPQNIESVGGRVFDYAYYLSKDDIFYIAETSDVSVVGTTKKRIQYPQTFQTLQGVLYTIKNLFIKNIEAHIPAPRSYLGEGLVISGKGSLDKELQTEFQKVGLIHIVVLSGFNISIVGETIVRLFSFLPKLIGGIFGAIGIVLFGMMTGGGATVWRSVVMSIIGIYARLSDRKNSALLSLFLAGSLMLFITPKLLLHDPSFQLSFMATFGLILFAEPFETRLLKIYAHILDKTKCLFGEHSRIHFLCNLVPKSFISLVASTLATQIFTLPMIIRFSGVVSLIALPVNIIVLPLIPLTMLLVFITGVVSFISHGVALLPAFVSWLLLSFELYIVRIASSLSFAAINLNQISFKTFFIMYICIFTLALILYFDSLSTFFNPSFTKSDAKFRKFNTESSTKNNTHSPV